MKTKVLKYADDGNTLVMPYKELTQIEGAAGVYYYPEQDKYNGEYWHVVFDINGVFVEEGSYRKNTVIEAELSILVNAKNGFLNRWENFWVQSLYIKLYELLGLDTSPLWERRRQLESERDAKKQAEAEAKAAAARAADAKESERLAALLTEYKAGKMVQVYDFINLLQFAKIELHPRTTGMLNKLNNSSEISPTRARLGKAGVKTVPRATFDAVFEVAAKLAAA
jgi:hypothetical protein